MSSFKKRKIGEFISFYRGELNMGKDAFAKHVGLDYSTITKLENGSRKNPRLSTLLKINKKLCIDLDELKI